MQKVYYRLLFAFAAFWNLAAAMMLIFNPDFLLAQLGIKDTAARLLARSFASSVTTWGIGYALIAINRERFRNFAWLGVFSKSIYFTIYAVAYSASQITFSAFTPAILDLVFAGLFAEFLLRTSRKDAGC